MVCRNWRLGKTDIIICLPSLHHNLLNTECVFSFSAQLDGVVWRLFGNHTVILTGFTTKTLALSATCQPLVSHLSLSHAGLFAAKMWSLWFVFPQRRATLRPVHLCRERSSREWREQSEWAKTGDPAERQKCLEFSFPVEVVWRFGQVFFLVCQCFSAFETSGGTIFWMVYGMVCELLLR